MHYVDYRAVVEAKQAAAIHWILNRRGLPPDYLYDPYA
jgi:hypothetical protein